MAASDSSLRVGVLWLVALGPLKHQSFELRARRITVGSSADNDLRLDEPTVSRRHAILEWRWRGWSVADLGSTNGTYVNGRRIEASSPVTLRRHDELRFGGARFGLVAPGDDVAEIGSGAVRRTAPSRSRFSWTMAAIVAILVFVGGFGLSEYLLNFDRLEQVADVAGANPAALPTNSATASGSVGGVSAAAPPHPMAVAAVPPGAPGSSALSKGTDLRWLARINHYRAMVNLPPVSDDPALSAGERNHTRYLIRNYGSLIRKGVDIGAAMHREDSAKPAYTPIGMRAGQQSDIDEWSGPQPPPSYAWAIDDWMTGAFHRLNILNPGLRQVAYGQWCEDGTCTAALNVIGGAERPSFNGEALEKPIMFPPPGSTVALGPLWGEWPNPMSPCSGYKAPAGLPISLQVGMMTDAKLGDYSFSRAGKSPAQLAVCGIDDSTYTNSSLLAQQRGRDALHDFGAVVLIPRTPLKKGSTYTVSMTVNGRRYKWSFSTVP